MVKEKNRKKKKKIRNALKDFIHVNSSSKIFENTVVKKKQKNDTK